MPRAIALRADFDAAGLGRLARQSGDAAQSRRLLALSAIYDGGTRAEAARIGDVTPQIVRDWVVRFNADGPEGLRNRKAPGPTPRLTVSAAPRPRATSARHTHVTIIRWSGVVRRRRGNGRIKNGASSAPGRGFNEVDIAIG